MKKLFILVSLLFTYNQLQAQSINPPVYDNEGFYANASILGAAWSLDDVNIDAEGGAGIGVKLGYNFNPKFGFFGSIDASSINSGNGDNYILGHFDLGVQGIFRTTTDRVRPFVKASVVGMSAQDEETEINGAGFGLGTGLYIGLSEKLGFDINYTHNWIDITEVKIGSDTYDADGSANTGRFFIGLTYHF
jgi:opacity protein-like surface antigen